MSSILFCLVGWMESYQGGENDPIAGGGKYVAENNDGGEIHNFTKEAINGQDVCFGFVQPSGENGQIRIERLGSTTDAYMVNKVLVVWVAKEPNQGGLRIVGWYKNASIYRFPQYLFVPGLKRYDIENEVTCILNIQSLAKDTLLLPSHSRTYPIPKAKNKTSPGMGRSNVWYAEGAKNTELVRSVRQYIDEYETLIPPKPPDSVVSNPLNQIRYTPISKKEPLAISIGENGLERILSEIEQIGIATVFEAEKQYLFDSCRFDLAEKVLVQNTNTCAGYDIISFTVDGKTKYISVKATTSENMLEPFDIIEHEVTHWQNHDDRYYLYRLYQLDIVKGSVNYFVLFGNILDFLPE